jgi:thioredoxin reductase
MTRTTTAGGAQKQFPVVVIGAGPVGLAAAAHLTARRVPFLVLEAGDRVGAAVRGWGHIRTFTPWQYIADPTAETLLATAGWTRPATPLPPTGDELVERYLEPLADVLGDAVRVGHRVLAVSRDGMDKSLSLGRAERPFVVRVQDAAGAVTELRTRAVIDASGTWEQRNPLGSSGLLALGEEQAAAFLVGPLPDVLGRDRARFAGRRTLVVGAGHSAANTLLSLGQLAAQEPSTQIVWAIRGASPSKVYGGGDADELTARGQLGTDLRALVDSGVVELVTGFSTSALEPAGDTVAVVSAAGGPEVRIDGVHNIAAATGFRPNLAMLSEVQLDLHPALEAPTQLAPLIDPQFHSCGTVPPHGHRDLAQPDQGLFIAGMKSYGRAPTFLITTGNEQVRSIVAALAGDVAAADEMQLVLPETGVCSVNAQGEDTDVVGGSCASDTGVEGLAGPDQAHRSLPNGVSAQGFTTGLPGGGLVAELALADVSDQSGAGRL